MDGKKFVLLQNVQSSNYLFHFVKKEKGIQKLTQLKLLQLVVRIVDSQMPFISQYISSFNNVDRNVIKRELVVSICFHCLTLISTLVFKRPSRFYCFNESPRPLLVCEVCDNDSANV